MNKLSRTPDDLIMIRVALEMLRSQSDELLESLWFEDLLRPLIMALKDEDHEAIICALGGRIMSESEKRKKDVQYMAFHISKNPKNYGVSELTKASVIAILIAEFPHFEKYLPSSKSGMVLWWKEIDATLGQLRGNEDPSITKWINNQLSYVHSDESSDDWEHHPLNR